MRVWNEYFRSLKIFMRALSLKCIQEISMDIYPQCIQYISILYPHYFQNASTKYPWIYIQNVSSMYPLCIQNICKMYPWIYIQNVSSMYPLCILNICKMYPWIYIQNVSND
eukprot:UN15941